MQVECWEWFHAAPGILAHMGIGALTNSTSLADRCRLSVRGRCRDVYICGLCKALAYCRLQAAETSDMGEADTTLLEEDVSLHSEQDPADGSRQNDNSVDVGYPDQANMRHPQVLCCVLWRVWFSAWLVQRFLPLTPTFNT